ncbi:MAG: exodeoxyribonuclease V subunit gamma [Verrucomicrobia subdivision 3 bacterium]|nr:exodeoxyribonuclease V subunit gamma [Limisphaerales bacterium]
MAGIQIHASNDLERLATHLAGLLRNYRPTDPFEPQMVVVPSLGMRHWLTRWLAETEGICANIELIFPTDFIERCVANGKDVSGYGSEALTWRILGLLNGTTLEEPARFLKDDPRQLKAFGLARRVAGLFDQYLLYRPEMLGQWPSGEAARWQAALWQGVYRGVGTDHPAALREIFLTKPTAAGTGPVFLFGLGMLPPEHWKVIRALATQQAVHLLVTQPTAEIWDDLLSVRDHWRQVEVAGSEVPASPDGHPLLVSMGRVGQEFHSMLLGGNEGWDEALFGKPKRGTLLRELQADIGAVDLPARDGRKAPMDDSLQVHSCHGALREVEVLHDQLLHLFQTHDDLAPHEVVVMTPDIESYAPLIRAVFDNPEDPASCIPFTIADRHPRAASAIVDAFLSLLEMDDTVLPINEVLTRLETAAVSRRFGIGAEELQLLYPRCRDAHINWGYDATHRDTSIGIKSETPEEQNTWRFGLDRMVLGYAMQADGEQLCEGRLPLPGVEGDLAEAVGGLSDFVDALHATAEDFQTLRPVAQWTRDLRALLKRFFDARGDEKDELGQLQKAIDRLEKLAGDADYTAEVDIAVVRAQLLATLEETKTRDGYLRGMVTCCALKPLRSVPFRVICLLGMNDGVFPRADRAEAFDLMAVRRKPGDRSVRDDDRYLFLETVLAAREVLYFSYLGQSQADEHSYPPSVAIGELLDALDRSFEFEKSARDTLVHEHRLQAFSAAYFDADNPKLISYSATQAAAAEKLRETLGRDEEAVETAAESQWFIKQPLDPPEAERKAVTLDELLQFYRKPVEHFVRNRMEMYLRSRDDLLADEEPFVLNRLDEYKINDDLLKLALDADVNLEDATAALRARFQAEGRLPHGEFGRATFENLRKRMAQFTQSLRAEPSGSLVPQADLRETVDLKIRGFHLTGELDSFADPRTQVSLRCANVNGREFLAGWIRHVVWHALSPATLSPTLTLVVGQKEGVQELKWLKPIEKIEDAHQWLAELLQIYWQGQQEPLLFFPKTSFAFMKASTKGADDPEAIQAKRIEEARKKWEPDEFGKGFPESEDAAHQLCFQNVDPLIDPRFAELAQAIFEPLVKHNPTRRSKALTDLRDPNE